MPRPPQNNTPAHHAHLYFDASTLEVARTLAERAGRELNVQVGRVHQQEVGPHPRWSCQLAFDASEFDKVIPWLEANRSGLDVFVHGLSGDELADHTTHAYWLGKEWPLKLEMFRKG